MAILTGPEIRRLSEPCRPSALKRGEFVWRDGRPHQVIAIDSDLGVCLQCQIGKQDWVEFPETEELTRCGPQGERIVITPFDPKWCGPNSYDVHLGDTIKVYEPRQVEHFSGQTVLDHVLDPENPPPTVEHLPGSDGRWFLQPGRVYLASTVEWFGGFGIVPVQHGRSSWGRYGLFTNVTAGFCDDSWQGHLTLELVAVEPILVRPGCRIGQIAFHMLNGERQPYQGRYNMQGPEPVASRFHI